MTEGQTPKELTTRDVLLQIDRRLTRIEDDQRDSDARQEKQVGELQKDMNARFAANDTKREAQVGELQKDMNARFAAQEAQVGELRKDMNARFAAQEAQVGELRKDMNARFAAIDVKFQWILGIVLASWLSTMGTLLLK